MIPARFAALWRRQPKPAGSQGVCASCRHFHNEPAKLEAAFPGLTAMGSGFAAVRAQDGLCALRGVYLPSHGGCDSWIRAGATDR
jgi:hypothetical protein